jgi:hypothetical protein
VHDGAVIIVCSELDVEGTTVDENQDVVLPEFVNQGVVLAEFVDSLVLGLEPGTVFIPAVVATGVTLGLGAEDVEPKVTVEVTLLGCVDIL